MINRTTKKGPEGKLYKGRNGTLTLKMRWGEFQTYNIKGVTPTKGEQNNPKRARFYTQKKKKKNSEEILADE